MGAQKIAEAGVRVDGYVRVIVEVLLERESVIRLENVERAVRPKLTAELLENGCEVLLSQMLEEVTGKHETDGGIGQEVG